MPACALHVRIAHVVKQMFGHNSTSKPSPITGRLCCCCMLTADACAVHGALVHYTLCIVQVHTGFKATPAAILP